MSDSSTPLLSERSATSYDSSPSFHSSSLLNSHTHAVHLKPLHNLTTRRSTASASVRASAASNSVSLSDFPWLNMFITLSGLNWTSQLPVRWCKCKHDQIEGPPVLLTHITAIVLLGMAILEAVCWFTSLNALRDQVEAGGGFVVFLASLLAMLLVALGTPLSFLFVAWYLQQPTLIEILAVSYDAPELLAKAQRRTKIIIILLLSVALATVAATLWLLGDDPPPTTEFNWQAFGSVYAVVFADLSFILFATTFGLFSLVCDGLTNNIDDFILDIRNGVFNSVDSLLREHLVLRDFVASATRGWSYYWVVFFVFCQIDGVVLVVYFSQMPTVVIVADWLLLATSLLQVILVYVLILWNITSVNDRHDTLIGCVRQSRQFSCEERASVITELELFPIQLTVFEVRITSRRVYLLLVSTVAVLCPVVLRTIV